MIRLAVSKDTVRAANTMTRFSPHAVHVPGPRRDATYALRQQNSTSFVYSTCGCDTNLTGARFSNITFVDVSSCMVAKFMVILQRARLVLRILIGLGGCGLIFCAMALHIAQQGANYILKLTPCAELLITSFATFYTFKAATGRISRRFTIFELLILVGDTILLPLYAFVALLAKASEDWEWTSFDDTLTSRLILATGITALVLGSLHLVSATISLYLLLHVHITSQRLSDSDRFRLEIDARRAKTRAQETATSTASPASPLDRFGSTRDAIPDYEDDIVASLSPTAVFSFHADTDGALVPHPPPLVNNRTGTMERKPFSGLTPPTTAKHQRQRSSHQSFKNNLGKEVTDGNGRCARSQLEDHTFEKAPGKRSQEAIKTLSRVNTRMIAPPKRTVGVPDKSGRRYSTIRLLDQTLSPGDDVFGTVNDGEFTPESRPSTVKTHRLTLPSEPDISMAQHPALKRGSHTRVPSSGSKEKTTRKFSDPPTSRYSMFPRSSMSNDNAGVQCRKGVDWVTSP